MFTGLYGVGQAHLFQRDADLAAVRGVPGVEFDAHRDPPFRYDAFARLALEPNGRIRITAIRFVPPRRANSRPNTIEERDVLLRLQEPRHPLVLGAMPPGDEGGAVDIAAIADLGRICVALEQERLAARAGSAQAAGEKQKGNSAEVSRPRGYAAAEKSQAPMRVALPIARRRLLRSRVDQRLDQLNGVQQRGRSCPACSSASGDRITA